MASSPDKPTLLTLPQELRDLIYEYTFSTEVKIDGLRWSATTQNASLLFTCRQTYHETLTLYYRCSAFRFWFLRQAVSWLIKLPVELRKVVKDVSFGMSSRDCWMLLREARLNLEQGVLKQRWPSGDKVVDLRAYGCGGD